MRGFILAIALASSGCSQSNFSQSDFAEFRSVARTIYHDLYSPSCRALRGFSRQNVLASEMQMVSDFERRLKGSATGLQLAVALQDSRYQQRTEGVCWNDEDPAFAEKHVEMTRKTVRLGLEELNRLAQASGGARGTGLDLLPDKSEFRYLVRELLSASQPQCAVSAQTENDEIFEPARRDIARFERSLRGAPYAAHFDLAKADVTYEQSITQVECAEPSPESPDQLRLEAAAAAKKQLALIRQRARM